ncbi:MAG: hypothetical protein ACQEQO_07300 [Thermodesulfobacteriota bacterium]
MRDERAFINLATEALNWHTDSSKQFKGMGLETNMDMCLIQGMNC